MNKLEGLKGFLEELKKEKSIIFNFEKISSFEREFFLSIQGVLNEKYNYHLDGLTNIHLIKFKDNLKKRDIHLDNDTNNLVSLGFILYAMLSKRNISLGYVTPESGTKIETENLKKFIETLENYIKTYEKVSLE